MRERERERARASERAEKTENEKGISTKSWDFLLSIYSAQHPHFAQVRDTMVPVLQMKILRSRQGKTCPRSHSELGGKLGLRKWAEHEI